MEDNATMLDKLRAENEKLKAMASEGGAVDVALEVQAPKNSTVDLRCINTCR